MRLSTKSSLLAAVAFFPLWWIVATFLFAQAGFVCGLRLHPIAGALGWIAAFAITQVLGEDRRQTIVAGFLSLTLWLALSLFGSAVHDCSWDGQSYHQDAIMYLARDWNPWARDLTKAETAQYFWISAFPKALWMSEAITFQVSGHLEAGKSVAWMIGLSFATVAALLTQRLPGPKLARWGIYGLLMLNPVVIGECWTFMLDNCVVWAFGGAMVSATTLLWPQFSPWSRKVSQVTLAAWLVLLASLKLTGLVYVVYMLIAMLLVRIVQCRNGHAPILPRSTQSLTKRIGLALVTVVLLFLTLGNPYGQNFLKHGHPLWPALGPGKKDIMVTQEHPTFLDAVGPVKFFWSMNSYTRTHVFNSPEAMAEWGLPKLKPPFALHREEILCFVAPDIHSGGYGPWYGGVVWAGVVLLASGWIRKWPGVGPLTALWVFVLLLILINPQSWLVRYAPYGWWLALVPLGLTLTVPKRNVQWAGLILIGLLGLQVVAIWLINTTGQIVCERDIRNEMRILAQNRGTWRVVIGTCSGDRERFREADLPLDTLPKSTSPAGAPAPGLYTVRLARTDAYVETLDKTLANQLGAARTRQPLSTLPQRKPLDTPSGE